MAKHSFVVGVFDGPLLIGAKCAHCHRIVLYENDKVPEDIEEEECPAAQEG